MRSAAARALLAALAAACGVPDPEPAPPLEVDSTAAPMASASIVAGADTFAPGADGDEAEYRAWVQGLMVPEPARARIDTTRWAVAYDRNPFYLRGDFDGDGAADDAVLVREVASGKLGIAVVPASGAPPAVLGAGSELGSGGDDFAWIDAWKVYPAGVGPDLAAEGMPGDAVGPEGIHVEAVETASALIYRTDRGWTWKQYGD